MELSVLTSVMKDLYIMFTVSVLAPAANYMAAPRLVPDAPKPAPVWRQAPKPTPVYQQYNQR